MSMKRKPIKIDWDELEEAFSNPQDDVDAYLDSVTGRVVLEGEGEESDLADDDDASFGRPRAPVGVRQSPTLLAIHPPDIPTKIEWLETFLEQAGGKHAPAVLERFRQAMEAEDPAEVLGEVLNEHPGVRDAWYLYRSERIQELIDAWLAEHEIEAIDPPPWRH